MWEPWGGSIQTVFKGNRMTNYTSENTLLCVSIPEWFSLFCFFQIQWWSKTHQGDWERQLDPHHRGEEVREPFGESNPAKHTKRPQCLCVGAITSSQSKICRFFLVSSFSADPTGAGGVLPVPFTQRKLQALRHNVAIPLQVERAFANSGQYSLTR